MFTFDLHDPQTWSKVGNDHRQNHPGAKPPSFSVSVTRARRPPRALRVRRLYSTLLTFELNDALLKLADELS